MEHETQVLNVDKEKIAQKLRELGAKETPELMQKRWVFDIKCLGATDAGKGEWIRLRQAGDNKPTLTYKNKMGTGISETEEFEIEVSDFEETAKILSKLNFEGKYYQENKRHKFVIDDIEFTLDTWPKIPTLLEIEAKSEEKVHKGLQMLGLEGKDEGHIGLIMAYKKYGIDLHSFKEIKFE